MRSDVPCIIREDDIQAHIEDTLRAESLTSLFAHLIDDCPCSSKTCSKCHIQQCHHAFAPDKRKWDGLHGHCNTCRKASRTHHRLASPDIVRVSEYNARARQEHALGTITAEQWRDLKAQSDFRCLCCGKPEPEITLTLDHVIPLSKGGAHSIDNVQPLCLACNKSKNTKATDYRSRTLSSDPLSRQV